MATATEGEVEEISTPWGHSYGVCLYMDNGECLRLPDVDTDRSRVERLLCRLLGEAIDEDQLRYLSEDLLGQAYDGLNP